MSSPASCGRKIKKGLSVLILFIFTLVIVYPPGEVNAITLSEEKELGQKIVGLIRKSMPLVEDGEVLTYVRNIGNRVAKEVGITTYQFQFFVVDQSVPNAFAVPGGNIFIYRGLIEMMSSEGELASILSHELAHIQARHLQRSIDEAKILSIGMLAGLLAGIFLGAPGLAAGGMAASETAALQYSRAHEMEADQFGFRFLCAAGYDSADMPSIMHKLQQCTWLANSRVPSYLSTHPALEERVQYLSEMVKKQKTASKKAVAPVTGDFQVMQATLIAEYTDQAKAFDRFQAGVKKGDKTSVFGLGRLYLRQNKWSEAVEQLRQAARLMPSSTFVLSTLGDAYYRAGKMQEAQSTFESALIVDPSAAIAHYKLALVLMDMGKKDEALDHLMQIEELAPMFPDVDYQLGVVLGQANKLGLAHYHLGRYYLQKQNKELAIMHFKKAKSLITDSPSKIEDINEALKELEPKKKGFFSSKE
ncbi:MAG: M48 family metalloprotease [Syntrophobacteraceae bacterium]|jgi:predicted Zn-dependent protease